MGAMNTRPHRRLRRTLFFGLTFLTAAAATALMLDALQASGLSAVERLGLGSLLLPVHLDCRRVVDGDCRVRGATGRARCRRD